jgi:replicative DNA helicase
MDNSNTDDVNHLHDHHAECSALGSMLIDPSCIGDVQEIIRSAPDFFEQRHQVIYQAMVDLYAINPNIDMVQVKSHMQTAGTLDGIGGVDYLVELVNSVPSAASAQHYSRTVIGHARCRQLVEIGFGIVERGSANNGRSVGDLIGEAESAIFALSSDDHTSEGPVSLSAVVQAAYDEAEAMQESGKPIGVATGFHDLDALLTGLQPGEMIVLAARPSVGKTALALNIAANVAMVSGIPALIFSLEMSRQDLGRRMLCTHSGVDSWRLRSCTLSPDDFQNLANSVGALADADIHIDDTSVLTAAHMASRARRLVSQKGIGLIIIDYLQLMTSTGSGRDNRQNEVAQLSRQIKVLAGELRVPVICLSQLNRSPEQREGHKPRLSDLRESGAIENDADVVLLMHREDTYHHSDPNYEPTNTADIIVAKQRNGPTGAVKLQFNDTTASFRNLAQGQERA